MTKRENAKMIVEAIKRFSEQPEALENFESYLTHNFDEWFLYIRKHPENITYDLDQFSRIYQDCE